MINDSVIVYIGDVGEYLCEIAKCHDVSAKLIDSTNYQHLQPGVYFTSVGDLPSLVALGAVLQQANEIIYTPPKHWSHPKAKTWTEDYLEICLSNSDQRVIGFERDPDLLSDACQDLAGHRKSKSCQIWIAGCSISHGLGVGPTQRYGNIIAEQLDLPVTYLTKPGSSVCWAGDQILRSDIRAGDKVFWGITSHNRLTYWNDIQNKIVCATLQNYESHQPFLDRVIKKNFLVSDACKYQAILAVRQVNNFCRKIKAELILATLISGLESCFNNLENFIPLAGLHGRNQEDLYLDIGSDGVHPGIKSHRFFADRMVKKYHQLYDFENKI